MSSVINECVNKTENEQWLQMRKFSKRVFNCLLICVAESRVCALCRQTIYCVSIGTFVWCQICKKQTSTHLPFQLHVDPAFIVSPRGVTELIFFFYPCKSLAKLQLTFDCALVKLEVAY